MSRFLQAIQRIRQFTRSTNGKLLFVAVCWQLTFTLIGWFVSQSQGIFGHMDHWDAGWYKHIIEFGYSHEGSPAVPAFYPLFPFIIYGLVTLSFGLLTPYLAALFLNTVAVWLGLIALVKIAQKLTPTASFSPLILVAFLSFPSAFFMHVFYSEALFIALAFWAYAFALERKWWAVGILLAVLTATRLPSLLFIALCGLEYLRVYSWNIKKAINKNLLWLLLAPLGFICYGFYLLAVRGDFFAMFHAYSATNDWTYHHFSLNIFATLYETVAFIFNSIISLRPTYEAFINYGLPLASIVLILVSASYILYKLRSRGIPLFVFGIFSVVMYTINSNVVSVHRYALACLCLYIAIVLLPKTRLVTALIALACIASLLVQLFIFAKFANGMFGG